MNLQLIEACKAALAFIQTYCPGQHAAKVIEQLESAIARAQGKDK